MRELLLFAIAFIITYSGVFAYAHWSVKKGIIDVPNDRSLHVEPTPRGGGLVIAFVCLLGYPVTAYIGGDQIHFGYIAASLLIVGISWLDDVRSVSSIVRLFCHTIAALTIVWDMGSLHQLQLPGQSTDLQFGLLSPAITVLWIVGLVNAYNFMDGIDGIAGLQALIAGAAWAFVSGTNGSAGTYYFGILIAASSLGFLIQNWEPAKIFMGDAGSAFLGFTFATIPIIASVENRARTGYFTLLGIVVVWFFVFDAVLTFFTRLFAGEQVWKPHRDHFYQQLARSGTPHARVSTLYGTLTVVPIILFGLSGYFGGNFWVFAVSIMVILSLTLAFYVKRKNILT